MRGKGLAAAMAHDWFCWYWRNMRGLKLRWDQLGLSLACLATAAAAASQPAAPVGAWRRLADLPLARAGAAGGWIGDRFVVAGGNYWVNEQKRWTERTEVYSPQDDRWEAGPSLPAPLAGAGAVADGRRLYVVGGEAEGKPSALAWRLEREGGVLKWTSLPELPRPRAYGALALVEDALYLAGGCDDPADLRTATREVLRLDLRRRSQGWKAVAPLPGPVRCLSAAASDGRAVFVFGGCNINGAGKVFNLDQACYYEPGVDRWSVLNPMPYAARAATAAYLGKGQVGLFGGYSGGPDDMERYGPGYGFERRVLVYETEKNHYRETAPLTGTTAVATVDVRDGRIAVVGGEDRARSRVGTHLTTTVTALLKNETSRPVVVCLGDSVTHGVGRSGVRERETYPRALESLLAGKEPQSWVVNAGLGGENTRQALQRFSRVFGALHRVDAVAIMYGLNDASLIDPGPTERSEPRIPLAEYRENLRALVRETRRQGARVVLCTPNPMTPAYPHARRGRYATAPEINFVLKDYAAAVREVAREERVDLVDVYELFRSTPAWEALLPDGIHPNATGLDMIARAVRRALIR